jgi:hypothetical protein
MQLEKFQFSLASLCPTVLPAKMDARLYAYATN